MTEIELNEYMMKEAIKEGKKALLFGEVPIGAVVVKNGKIVGRGHNSREVSESPLAHAEMNAMMDAARNLGSWRLTECDIYVTIEPCPMCTGALFQSRIRTIYYGASDLKAGACGSVFNLFDYEQLNHVCEVVPGILNEECRQMMQDFFRSKRKK